MSLGLATSISTARLLGGAGFSVATGRATRIDQFAVRERTASGVVVTTDGKPVPDGTVILTVTSGKGDGLRAVNQTTKLASGKFSVRIQADGEMVQAYYLPPPGYGEATSPMLPLR